MATTTSNKTVRPVITQVDDNGNVRTNLSLWQLMKTLFGASAQTAISTANAVSSAAYMMEQLADIGNEEIGDYGDFRAIERKIENHKRFTAIAAEADMVGVTFDAQGNILGEGGKPPVYGALSDNRQNGQQSS